MANRVNGVSALHTDLVKETLFADLHRLHPDRIVNQTNGVTPRRWMRLANPRLSGLITDSIGSGWEADLDRLAETLGVSVVDDGDYCSLAGTDPEGNRFEVYWEGS